MSQTLDETEHTVRRISAELRPSVLDDLGLAAAIEWQARDLQANS
jgi:signal transduction histidine kinase